MIRPDVYQRADKFKEVFLHRIKNLRWQSYAHGSLTVRNILDMREQCLSEYRFHDPYLNQKTLENEQVWSLKSFASLVASFLVQCHRFGEKEMCDCLITSVLLI